MFFYYNFITNNKIKKSYLFLLSHLKNFANSNVSVKDYTGKLMSIGTWGQGSPLQGANLISCIFSYTDSFGTYFFMKIVRWVTPNFF